MNTSARLGLVGLALALSACSALQEEKINYKSATKAATSTLEVPPDLTQLTRDSRYNLPGGSTSAAAQEVAARNAQNVGLSNTAVSQIADVRIERSGNQRWLVVGRPADKLWDPVRQFWDESGFVLIQDQPQLGIMETDWAENRAKIPQDLLRQTLGRVLDSLYSTGERDKFRTRFERNAAGGTDIYITHRGMQEVYTSQNKDQTIWQPRPTDPELETEFLRRLMVKLGASEEQAKAAAATAPAAATGAAAAAQPTARIATVENRPVVQIDDGFDRAWRRVGVSLDRTGFTVEDRNRAEGVYFVRYVAPVDTTPQKSGFFGKLFSSTPKTGAPVKYRVLVRSTGDNASTVSILNEGGTPETSVNAERIVRVLAADLK